MSHERPNTERKALTINLDPRRYGTFAEIGAGQEVVRWFFRVGGAAGTIAKSMSAYDMAVSDAIYGQCDRYVCRQRLEAMLDHEHALNLDRLRDSRGDTTAFFAFADTVSARNFKGTNECHGWMGVRFQAHPRDQDSQIILHVRMLDTENALQQEALGIVGVNLLYGAFFLNHEPDQLIESLLDNLTTQRIEIDMIEFSGIAFRHVDNRRDEPAARAARPVERGDVLGQGGSAAAVRGALQEADPGRARQLPPGHARQRRHAPLRPARSSSASRAIERSRVVDADGNHDAQPAGQRGEPGRHRLRDFLARADVLAACGQNGAHLRLLRVLPAGRVPGAATPRRRSASRWAPPACCELFDEKYYGQLDGGILESFGRLFKNDLKLYIYPLLDRKTGELTTVQNLQVAPELRKLYEYLVEKGCIEQLDNYNPAYLPIFSRDVIEQIKAGNPAWSNHVPAEVAEVIRRRGFFGHKRAAATEVKETASFPAGIAVLDQGAVGVCAAGCSAGSG